MLKDFIWNGRRPQLKNALLQADKTQGGLHLVQWRIRGSAAGARPPTGPDYFVLTYKFFET